MPTRAETADEKETRLMQTIELMAYPVTVAAGYKSFVTSVRRGIYKNVAQTNMLDELQKEHKTIKQAILEGKKESRSVVQAMAKENTRFRYAIREKFSEHGFNGVFDFWKGLHPNQKTEAWVTGATVTGILLGTVMLVTQNHSLNSKLAKRAREEAEKQNGIS